MTQPDLWAPASMPDQPPPGLARSRVIEVADAVLTPLARGPVGDPGDGPRKWMTGAVHDRHGTLVPESQRSWHGDPMSPAATDPDRVPVPEDAPRLAGTWLYGGHWMSHFGHFLVEVLPGFWPEPREVGPLAGIVAHRSYRGSGGSVTPQGERRSRIGRPIDLQPWQADLLRLAGYGDLPVHLVRARTGRVDRLLVPTRPVLLKSWALPAAADLWRRVSDAVGERGDAGRIYLSRSRWHAEESLHGRHQRGEAERDRRLDELFAAAGFEVVHPELLPIAEQIALVRGADIVAGPSGSALHLAAFADPGTRVLEIGDARTQAAPMPTQRTVDAACGHRTAFVPSTALDEIESVLATL